MLLENDQLKFLVFAHHLTMLQACTEAVIESKVSVPYLVRLLFKDFDIKSYIGFRKTSGMELGTSTCTLAMNNLFPKPANFLFISVLK